MEEENEEPIVFIVDDDDGSRESLRMLLETVDIKARTYATAEEFLDDFGEDMYGCLVADVRMPGMDGLQLQEHLRESGVEVPVIILTGHGDIPIAVQSLKAGAVDFIEKPFREQHLLDSVHEAISISEALHEEKKDREGIRRMMRDLTERELEVMELLISGKGNKEVASILGISRKTVDFHRVRILEKLRVRSLVELTLLAARIGELSNVPAGCTPG